MVSSNSSMPQVRRYVPLFMRVCIKGHEARSGCRYSPKERLPCPGFYSERWRLVQLFAIRKSSENSLSDPSLGFTLKTVG